MAPDLSRARYDRLRHGGRGPSRQRRRPAELRAIYRRRATDPRHLLDGTTAGPGR